MSNKLHTQLLAIASKSVSYMSVRLVTVIGVRVSTKWESIAVRGQGD